MNSKNSNLHDDGKYAAVVWRSRDTREDGLTVPATNALRRYKNIIDINPCFSYANLNNSVGSVDDYDDTRPSTSVLAAVALRKRKEAAAVIAQSVVEMTQQDNNQGEEVDFTEQQGQNNLVKITQQEKNDGVSSVF